MVMLRSIAILLLALGCFVADADSQVKAPPPVEKKQIVEPVFGVPLQLGLLAKGDIVPLHSVVVTPRPPNKGQLTLEFPRGDLSDQFVDEFFYKKNKNLWEMHPFSQRGVEAVLTFNRLILKLQRGVALQLRSDIPGRQSYKTFKTPEAKAKVVDVKGDVYVSLDTQVVEKELNDFYVALRGPESKEGAEKVYRQPDGSYLIFGTIRDSDFPPRIYPKVIK